MRKIDRDALRRALKIAGRKVARGEDWGDAATGPATRRPPDLRSCCGLGIASAADRGRCPRLPPAQVLAVKLDHVEGAEHGSLVVTPGTKRFKDCEPGFVGDDDFAVDQAGSCRQRCNGRHDQRKAAGEFVAVAGEQPHTRGVPQRATHWKRDSDGPIAGFNATAQPPIHRAVPAIHGQSAAPVVQTGCTRSSTMASAS